MNVTKTISAIFVLSLGGAELAAEEEIAVEIEFDYTPGTPDVFYMRNGDPGYPGDPAEVENVEIIAAGFHEITFCNGIKLTIAPKTNIGEWLSDGSMLQIEESLYEDGERILADREAQDLEDRAAERWQEKEWGFA